MLTLLTIPLSIIEKRKTHNKRRVKDLYHCPKTPVSFYLIYGSFYP